MVDDAPDIRLLVRLALSTSDGFSVVAEAATGPQAIELAARHQPDVVLLDVSLPEMDGLESLPEILRASPGSKVVMFSAFQTQALADTALRLGAVGYITKEIVLSNLAEHLTGLLDAADGRERSARVTASETSLERETVSSAANVVAGGVERFHVTFEQSTIGAAALTLSGGCCEPTPRCARWWVGRKTNSPGHHSSRSPMAMTWPPSNSGSAGSRSQRTTRIAWSVVSSGPMASRCGS